MLRLAFFICLSTISLTSAQRLQGLPIKPCQGTVPTGQLLNLRVTDCNRYPCVLRKGTSTTISFDFVPSAGTNTVVTGAFGKLANIPLPFIGTNGTPACPKIGNSRARQNACPLAPGQPHTYSNTFPILRIYPTTNVEVQWELLDEFNQKIVCFNIPAKIA